MGLKILASKGGAGSSPAAGTSGRPFCGAPEGSRTPRVYTLPRLRLTRASDQPGPGHLPVDHQHNGKQVKYWRAPWGPGETCWTSFAKLPLVLDSDGSPWAPACLWLFELARSKPLGISSLTPVAQDLAAYKAYLDELALEWADFSAVDKYIRPTYLYFTRLRNQINDRELAPSTAKRRMSTVIRFYRFLLTDSRLGFEPANAPWVERGAAIRYLDSKGFRQVAEVVTTDVSIKIPRRQDAWEGTIDDGGKLRPLSMEEQKVLIVTLKQLDNIEYSLMHWVALLSGARAMTVLTLRVRDFERPPEEIAQWPHKLRCGPGTGIDTKRDVSGVYLMICSELYNMLHTYTVSARARARRSKSMLGEDALNYVFLTRQGQPYYESKEDRNAVRHSSTPLRRSALTGRPLRKFIESELIPAVRRTLPNFKYSFHDLRATFGMNWVDDFTRADAMSLGSSYVWAVEQLRKLMWHKSVQTTERYLGYREHMRHLERAQQGWSTHLLELLTRS